LTRATRTLAALVLPGMALVAAAAPQLVATIFGQDWEPAIPIVQVLAVAGAVQAIYQPSTTPLVLGLGHAALNLRYALLTTAVSTAGIVAGLPFGPLGVAVGYCCAVIALIPVEWIIRRRLLGLPLTTQARSLLPGAHVAVWVAGAYTVVAVSTEGHDIVVLGVGTLVALATGLGVMRAAHRSQFTELVLLMHSVIGRTPQRPLVEGAGTVS
jgi:O-antigen/teichoic acid export membrane protein